MTMTTKSQNYTCDLRLAVATVERIQIYQQHINMDPPDDDEVEAAAPPQQRRRQTRGVRWVEWTLRVTVSFVILSLLKLEPIARKWVRDHNSSIDLPHQEEKLLKSSTDDNDSQNKIIQSSSSSVVRNNKLSQKSESFPSQDSIENGSTSPHQVDCKSFVDKQDEIYKETATEPSFMMNIHPPLQRWCV